MIRRCNLFGDLNHCFKYDIPQDKKPCSDSIVRLAMRKHCKSYGDAESLQVDPKYMSQQLENITIFHYGYVREDSNHIKKTINMQGWFHGKNSTPDQRVAQMSERYEWEKLKERELLGPIPMSHPKFSEQWAQERQKNKIPLTD
jgi:hypothetical protein